MGSERCVLAQFGRQQQFSDKLLYFKTHFDAKSEEQEMYLVGLRGHTDSERAAFGNEWALGKVHLFILYKEIIFLVRRGS